MSEEILAGRNSVTEALRSGRSINKLLVQDGIKGGSVSEIIGLAKTAGVVWNFVKLKDWINWQMACGIRGLLP